LRTPRSASRISTWSSTTRIFMKHASHQLGRRQHTSGLALKHVPADPRLHRNSNGFQRFSHSSPGAAPLGYNWSSGVGVLRSMSQEAALFSAGRSALPRKADMPARPCAFPLNGTWPVSRQLPVLRAFLPPGREL
jgi:hypothetical protein